MFLRITEDGVQSKFINESGDNSLNYKIKLGAINTLYVNDEPELNIQTGFNMYRVDNKLHRYYRNFNSAELSAINSFLNFNGLIIIASTIDIPDSVISILKSKGAQVIVKTTDCMYIASYDKRFGIIHEDHRYQKAELEFNGMIDRPIVYQSEIDKDFSFTALNNTEISFNLLSGSIDIPGVEGFPISEPGYYKLYTTVTGNLDVVIIGEVTEFVASQVATDYDTLTPGIGVHGIKAQEVFEQDSDLESEQDIVMILNDYREPQEGKWFTKKINGRWVLEEDENGPINNWFVFNRTSKIRHKKLISPEIKELA